MSEYPFVSALIVTRNEQKYIRRALLSLINQTYPSNKYEIIIVDGESTDDTSVITEELIKEYKTDSFEMRLLKNPKRILASGWNIGIKDAKGVYVVRIDAHAEASEDFIEKSVRTMENVRDAVCVGGRLITKAMDGDNDVVSKVLSSPFGVGNSSFRVSDTAGYSDTAVYGLYKKSIFDELGYFDERYIRNQDIELHSRIRSVGGKFYFNPEISCVYYSRNSVRKMVKQGFENGRWNMVLLKNHGSALRLRHLVPFAFVLYIIISLLLGFWSKWFWVLCLGVIALHMLIGLYAAFRKTRKLNEVLVMPILFLLLHLSYGTGYLAGIFTKIDG